MVDLDRRLADVARRQRMLITIDDVLTAGGRHDHVQARMRAGRWVRVEDGVYLVAGAPFDWLVRMLAAVLAAGTGAVVSHLAAARLYGFPGFERAGLELTIPRGRRFRRPGVRSHESTDLDRCRVVERDGIPVTDPDRTILDLGRYIGVRRLARVVEHARRQGLVTWGSLIATLTAHARPGRHGVRRLRAVIAADCHRDEVTDTDVELLLIGLIRQAGLPEPVLHHRVHDDNGRFVAEVDLAYPWLRIAIECDGDVHLLSEVRERDLPRQNDLVIEGWTVLRFSRERILRRPDAVVRDIRTAVDAALR